MWLRIYLKMNHVVFRLLKERVICTSYNYKVVVVIDRVLIELINGSSKTTHMQKSKRRRF